MSIYDFTVRVRKGEILDMQRFNGKVLLIVNTATGCGFTPQYRGLEELYERYPEKGLEILRPASESSSDAFRFAPPFCFLQTGRMGAGLSLRETNIDYRLLIPNSE